MESTNLLSLILKTAIILSVVWLLWALLLRKVTRFSFVRGYLISGTILSILMPIFLPTLQKSSLFPTTNQPVEITYTLQAVIAQSSVAATSSINWLHAFTILFLSVSGFYLLKIFVQLYKIFHLASIGKKRKSDGIIIIEHNKDISPFSFLHLCFINPSLLPPTKMEDVIIHERAHATKMHSVDIILVEFVGVFQWFNPFYWLLRNALVEIHEYQADRTAISLKTDPHAYLDAIVSLAFNGVALPIGNNFNKSLTLKRLAMINIGKKSKWAILKLALAIVVSTPVLLAVSSETEAASIVGEHLIEITEKNDPPQKKEGEVFHQVEEMPKFNGEAHEKFQEFIAEHLKYPDEAKQKGLEGRVFANFIVETDGTVSNVKIVRGVHPLLDAEVIRVIELSPKWTPGKQRGQEVRTTFTFPILFKK